MLGQRYDKPALPVVTILLGRLGLLASLLLGVTLLLPASAQVTSSGVAADRVLGQPNFESSICNNSGVSARSLCHPFAVAVDSEGHVYVADAINNRVLEYDSPLATDALADRVLGQPNFTSSGCNSGGVSATSLCAPFGIAVDDEDNLYVADFINSRVLEYDSPLETDTVADRVFGQPDFTSNTCNNGGVSSSSLCIPFGATVDGAGNVYIADDENHRVLEYDSPLETDTVADRVLGQPDFTSRVCNNGGLSNSSLCGPRAVAVDTAGDLYVADLINNRVLEYDSPIETDTEGGCWPEHAGRPPKGPAALIIRLSVNA